VIDAVPAEPADSPRGPCAECGARLAHDQSYCISCGARRGPLPAPVASLIGEMLERSSGPPAPAHAEAEDPDPGRDSEPDDSKASRDAWVLRPRAAAVAVMAMLSFGVVAGSFAGSEAFSATGAPVLLAVSPTAAAASAPTPAPTSDPTLGRGGSAPAPAGAAAPLPAQTVTVPAPVTPAGPAGGSTPAAPAASLPPVKHVFLIVLSDQGFKQSFGPHSKGPYLSTTLSKQGELLPNYYAVAAGDLANEVALVSGQGPTPQTTIDCPVFADLTPGAIGKEGQASGSGCVYPSRATTLADQLVAQGETWKAYVEGIGGGPVGAAQTCRHPALGAGDADWLPRPGDPYVTWRNPFVYFHSVIGATTCAKQDVGLEQLAGDIKSPSTAPTLSYIVPSPCDDGSDAACAAGSPSGLAASDTFLRSVVPEIEHSAAYRAGGLIAITFDHAPQTGPQADPSACCDNPTYPNLAAPTPGSGKSTTTGAAAGARASADVPTTTTTTTAAPTTTTATTATTSTPAAPATTTTATNPPAAPPPTTPAAPPTATTPPPSSTTTSAPAPPTSTPSTPTTSVNPLASGQTTATGGGGQVGLLLISQYVKPGSQDTLDFYNHYSLLGSIEDLLGLRHLGYATDPQLPLFFAGTYNAFK
jgi:phosphatidylinositol-3-phosphatase